MALHSIAQRSLVLFSWEEARGVARDLVGVWGFWIRGKKPLGVLRSRQP